MNSSALLFDTTIVSYISGTGVGALKIENLNLSGYKNDSNKNLTLTLALK